MGLCGSSQSIERKMEIISLSPFFCYMKPDQLELFVAYFRVTRISANTELFHEVCVCIYVCMYMCVSMCVYMCVYVCVCVHIYMCVYMYVFVRVCVGVCMCSAPLQYIYYTLSFYVRVRVYVLCMCRMCAHTSCVCMCACVCACMYV